MVYVMVTFSEVVVPVGQFVLELIRNNFVVPCARSCEKSMLVSPTLTLVIVTFVPVLFSSFRM